MDSYGMFSFCLEMFGIFEVHYLSTSSYPGRCGKSLDPKSFLPSGFDGGQETWRGEYAHGLGPSVFSMSRLGGFCEGLKVRSKFDQLIARKFEQKISARLVDHSEWLAVGCSGLSSQTMGLEAPKVGT